MFGNTSSFPTDMTCIKDMSRSKQNRLNVDCQLVSPPRIMSADFLVGLITPRKMYAYVVFCFLFDSLFSLVVCFC